jgi:predicted O-linked N-acetylglucosamine transferase (SPINDLY family)
MNSMAQAFEQHFNLGRVFQEQGRLDEAIASYRQALHCRPDFAEGYYILGVALYYRRLDDAAAAFAEAVRLQPDFAGAHYNLGFVRQEQGRLEEAIASYRLAVQFKPDYGEAIINLGNALKAQGKLDEAIASYRQAVRVTPNYAEAHNNLGMALAAQGSLAQAVCSFEQALRLKPDLAEAHNNLGNALKDQGQIEAAIASLGSALALRPDVAIFHANLVFSLHYHPDCDGAALGRETRRWNDRHAEPLAIFRQPHANDLDPRRRLRVGYVSPDFCKHALAYVLLPLLSHHDHRQVEVFCYSEVPRPDEMTARLHSCADGWRNTVGLSDEQVADLVRQDRIDILVDLALHTANNRLLVFARKPAPIQVSWLGYPSTTGMSAIDYRLTDPYLDPPGADDSCYAEQSIRLSDTFWCYTSPGDHPEVNSLPALTNGFVTFGCLSNFCKVNDRVLVLWAKVMGAVPQSRLLLLAPPGPARDRVLAVLRQEGIAESRVDFADRLPRERYLELYHRIDLCLDTLPYNGHTTSLDAFWMGVPTISLIGTTAVGRAGFAQLCNLGLPELAARTPQEFTAIAVGLAADLPKLAELRACLRARMRASPLLDGPRFARNIEHVYRDIWQRWCVAMIFPQALQHHQSGDLHQAEMLYRHILHFQPNHADALHLLGVIAHQAGHFDVAVAHMQEALRLDPALAAAHYNLGMVQAGQGKNTEAAASFQQAVGLTPDHAEAHNNLGNALKELNRLDEAIASISHALRLKPDYAAAYLGLGSVLVAQGKMTEAGIAYQQAIVLKPDYAEAHNNLGNTLKAQGKLEEAIASYRRAVNLQPEHAQPYCNLGAALAERGDFTEAASSYQQALRLKPDFFEVYNNLGNLLTEQGKYDEAIAHYRQALSLKPDYADACYNLGKTLTDKGDLDEAIVAFQQAVRLRPDYAEAYNNLGNALKAQGKIDEAISAFRRALSLAPAAASIHSNLVFTLHCHPDCDAAALYQEARRWNDRHAQPLAAFHRLHTNDTDPDRRLRIGYVSPDFSIHAMANVLLPLLSHHDHRYVEVVCYAEVPRPDEVTQRFRACADVWRSTVGLSDDQMADLVRQDEIDILVDLAMHTAHNRLLVFARKPAPIQACWLGYPGTTGLTAIDYRLTDPHFDPPAGSDADYSEKSLRLPDTFWCTEPRFDLAVVPVPPAMKNGYFTLGCLNNFAKVNDRMLELWSRLLLALPHSRLLLHAPRGSAREHVLAKFQQEGVASARVEFIDRQSKRDYFAVYNRIDVCLDPWPCNGGVTSLDALWMGVPIIALVGETAVGRAGWSLLSNLHLPELAALTADDYVAIAVHLAEDLPRLQELRAGLRERMRASPLMNSQRFARNMEQAYREMWRTWVTERNARLN